MHKIQRLFFLVLIKKLGQQKSLYAFFFHAFIGNDAVDVLETIYDFYDFCDVFSVDWCDSFPIFLFDFIY